MKKHSLFAALPVLLLTLLLTVSGCDWVRASLGKPTSADLAALRMAKEAREQAVRDSIAAAKAELESRKKYLMTLKLWKKDSLS